MSTKESGCQLRTIWDIPSTSVTVFGPSLRQDSAVVNADDCFIAALPAEATVLELGCGSGSPVAKHMAEHGLHVTGVDSSPTLTSRQMTNAGCLTCSLDMPRPPPC